jgi:hypothetical protein
VSARNFERFGIAQRDGTSFVLSSQQADELIRNASGNPRILEESLGLPNGFFDDEILRVDIPNPSEFNLRIPSGNEAGANSQFLPGGLLPTGLAEAVIDAGNIDANSLKITKPRF